MMVDWIQSDRVSRSDEELTVQLRAALALKSRARRVETGLAAAVTHAPVTDPDRRGDPGEDAQGVGVDRQRAEGERGDLRALQGRWTKG